MAAKAKIICIHASISLVLVCKVCKNLTQQRGDNENWHKDASCDRKVKMIESHANSDV